MHGDEGQVLQVNKYEVGHFPCLNFPGIDSGNLEAVLRDHLHQLGGGQHGGILTHPFLKVRHQACGLYHV